MIVDVVFAFDDRYAEQIPVAVESLLLSATGDVSVWLVTTATAKATMQDRVHRQVADRAHLRFLVADDTFRSLPTSVRPALAYISAGTNLRLLLPELLPEAVSRYLYLDADVFVEGDLQPLFGLAMGGVPVAAVRDRYNATIGAQGGLPGLPPSLAADTPYFNAGVLLVDRAEWNRCRITDRCLEYLDCNRETLRFGDQDSLNVACAGAWLEVPNKWNYQGWRPDPGQLEMRPDDVRITHYLGRRKPWHPDFPLEAHRRRYAEMAEAARTSAERRVHQSAGRTRPASGR
jgi:lipopolysaccharide biosynthesis glycosyltransferase